MLHTGLSPFACDICGRGFARKDKLKSHILSLHTQNETPSTSQLPSGAFKCDICFEIFPSTSQLDRHQNFHKGESFYQGVKRFSCDACDKMFVSKRTMETHKRVIHLGESSHKCSICNKPFAKLYDLKTHQVVHTGERPHSCDVCNKTFSVKSSLKEHMRLHTGERPFKCDICDKSYTRKRDLAYHKKCHQIKANNSLIVKEEPILWKTESIILEPSIVKQEIIENCEYTEYLNPEHLNSAEHKDIKLENTTEHFNVQTFIKLENSEQKNNEHVVAEHYNEHYEHLKHDGIDEFIGVEHTEHINIEPMEHINVGTDEHSIKLEAEEIEESHNNSNFEEEESEEMNCFANCHHPINLLESLVQIGNR